MDYLDLGREDYFSAIANLNACGFCSEEFPLPLGAKDRLHFFIVALLGAFHIIISVVDVFLK